MSDSIRSGDSNDLVLPTIPRLNSKFRKRRLDINYGDKTSGTTKMRNLDIFNEDRPNSLIGNYPHNISLQQDYSEKRLTKNLLEKDKN